MLTHKFICNSTKINTHFVKLGVIIISVIVVVMVKEKFGMAFEILKD